MNAKTNIPISPLLYAKNEFGKNISPQIVTQINSTLVEFRPQIVNELLQYGYHIDIWDAAISPKGQLGSYDPYYRTTNLVAEDIRREDPIDIRRTVIHESLGHALLNSRNFANAPRYRNTLDIEMRRLTGHTIKREVNEVLPLYKRYQLLGRIDQAQFLLKMNEILKQLPEQTDYRAFLKLLDKQKDKRFEEVFQGSAKQIRADAQSQKLKLKDEKRPRGFFFDALATCYCMKSPQLVQEGDRLKVSFNAQIRHRSIQSPHKTFKRFAVAAGLAAGFGTGFTGGLGTGIGVLVLGYLLPHIVDGSFTSEKHDVILSNGGHVSIGRHGKKFAVTLPNEMPSEQLIWDEYAHGSNDPEEYLCQGIAFFNNTPDTRQTLKKTDPDLYQYIEREFGLLVSPEYAKDKT